MTGTKPDVVNADFLAFVQEINKGTSAAELSEALQEIVRAVRETGRPGELIFRLKVKPVDSTDGNQVTVEDDITTKLPRHRRKASLFFATRQNTLTRNNPDQMDMFEKEAK